MLKINDFTDVGGIHKSPRSPVGSSQRVSLYVVQLLGLIWDSTGTERIRGYLLATHARVVVGRNSV